MNKKQDVGDKALKPKENADMVAKTVEFQKQEAEYSAKLQELLDQNAALVKEKDGMKADLEIEKKRMADLEVSLKDAHSIAKGIVMSKLNNWPGVDKDKPRYHLKYTITTDGGEALPAEGVFLVTAGSGENARKANLFFSCGRCVTNDLGAARGMVKLGKGITLEVL